MSIVLSKKLFALSALFHQLHKQILANMKPLATLK